MSDSGGERESTSPSSEKVRDPSPSLLVLEAAQKGTRQGRVRIEAEVTRAELVRAAQLLARVGDGPSCSIRAAFAGEARDAYEAAMQRLERLRGTQPEESLKLASLRVRLLLEEVEREDTLLPPPLS